MNDMKKILYVTGASSDVGIELLKDIYPSYDCIYLQYRNMNEKLESFINGIRNHVKVVPLECDLQKIEMVEDMIQTIVSLDELPNHIIHLAAPKPVNGYFHSKEWDSFEYGWEMSVRSIVAILRSFLPNMAKTHYGRVLFMLSSCACGTPPKFQTEYVTIKYTLLGLMRALSAEYSDKGITVNGISPDMMDTKFLSDIPHLIVETYAAKKPTGRNLRVEEIIPIMKYMLSDDAESMTGQNICIGEG